MTRAKLSSVLKIERKLPITIQKKEQGSKIKQGLITELDIPKDPGIYSCHYTLLSQDTPTYKSTSFEITEDNKVSFLSGGPNSDQATTLGNSISPNSHDSHDNEIYKQILKNNTNKLTPFPEDELNKIANLDDFFNQIKNEIKVEEEKSQLSVQEIQNTIQNLNPEIKVFASNLLTKQGILEIPSNALQGTLEKPSNTLFGVVKNKLYVKYEFSSSTNNTLLVLQLRQEGEIPLNIVFSKIDSLSSPSSPVFVVSLSEKLKNKQVVNIELLLPEEGMTAIAYFQEGLRKESKTIITSSAISENSNPITLVIFGYLALQMFQVDNKILKSIIKVLDKHFSWLPDTFIINAAYLQKCGKLDEAIQSVLKIHTLGLPFTNQGLVIAQQILKTSPELRKPAKELSLLLGYFQSRLNLQQINEFSLTFSEDLIFSSVTESTSTQETGLLPSKSITFLQKNLEFLSFSWAKLNNFLFKITQFQIIGNMLFLVGIPFIYIIYPGFNLEISKPATTIETTDLFEKALDKSSKASVKASEVKDLFDKNKQTLRFDSDFINQAGKKASEVDIEISAANKLFEEVLDKASETNPSSDNDLTNSNLLSTQKADKKNIRNEKSVNIESSVFSTVWFRIWLFVEAMILSVLLFLSKQVYEHKNKSQIN